VFPCTKSGGALVFAGSTSMLFGIVIGGSGMKCTCFEVLRRVKPSSNHNRYDGMWQYLGHLSFLAATAVIPTSMHGVFLLTAVVALDRVLRPPYAVLPAVLHLLMQRHPL